MRMHRRISEVSENPGKAQQDLIESFLQGSDAGHAGSLYIHGDTIYSYGPHFPVARLEGGTVYVVPRETSPSRTTSGHIGAVKRTAERMGYEVRQVHLARQNPAASNPPAYFVIEPSSGRVLDVVRAKAKGTLSGMQGAYQRARRKAQEYADRSGSEIVVVVHPYVPGGFRKGSIVSPLFYHYGASPVPPAARNPMGKSRQERDTQRFMMDVLTKRRGTYPGLAYLPPRPSERRRGQKSLRGLVEVYRSKRTPKTPTKRLRDAGISFKVDFDHRSDTFSLWVAPAKKAQAERLVQGSKPRKAKASKPKKTRKASRKNAPKRACANPCRNPSHRHKKKTPPSNLDSLLTPAEAKKARKFA